MSAPRWLEIARKYDGFEEVPGPESNAWIRSMWLELKNGGWYWSHYGKDDSLLPWCGAFVARCMKEAGLAYPDLYASARAWGEWGQVVSLAVGAIAVLSRKGGAHVAIVAGVNEHGMLMLWGGNQADRVSCVPFNPRRVIAIRWPAGEPLPQLGPLPLIPSRAAVSTNEA